MLLDANVLIYASDEGSALCKWARRTIADSVAGEGAAVNAVSLAVLCVGDAEPESVADPSAVGVWRCWTFPPLQPRLPHGLI